MNINHPAVTVRKCHTDIGEYVVDFYGADISFTKVRHMIRQKNYTITKREEIEGGELTIYYVERC